MELDLYRKYCKDGYTIGKLSVNGSYLCDTMEDKDRGLTSDMSLAEIAKIKIKGKTAIPTGRYQVLKTFSNKYKREMPILDAVPGYAGIRIHSGNTAADTEGCILPGKNTKPGEVTSSRAYTDLLYKHIDAALSRKEKIWITIHK